MILEKTAKKASRISKYATDSSHGDGDNSIERGGKFLRDVIKLGERVGWSSRNLEQKLSKVDINQVILGGLLGGALGKLPNVRFSGNRLDWSPNERLNLYLRQRGNEGIPGWRGIEAGIMKRF